MKSFFKKSTAIFATLSSVGFASALYLCAINHPWLRVVVLESLGMDVYITLMASCFVAVFLAGVSHTLYLREKLYDSRRW